MQNLRLNISLAKFNRQVGLESSDIKMKYFVDLSNEGPVTALKSAPAWHC